MYSMNDYQDEMQRTYKPNRKPNHALGVAGEVAESVDLVEFAIERFREITIGAMMCAGRICDMVKKDEYHKRNIDSVDMKKELGDVLWYVAALATDYGLTLEDVARTNIAKLEARYPAGFVHGGGNRAES